MATLERIGPTGRHDLVVLDPQRGRLSIGKSTDNDLVVDDDPAISRVHAVFEHVGPAWCVSDLGSTNGTMLNGERILARRTLTDRDEILIGRTRLLVRDPSAGRLQSTEPLRTPPTRTPREQEVLVALCRPVLDGRAFTQPASVRTIADALFVGQAAVKQHLDHLYSKFGILGELGEARRVILANEAIQTGAVTLRDLQEPASP
jgi:FHA domain